MYSIIAQRQGMERILFKSLVDLFNLDQYASETKDSLNLPELQSFIPTKRTTEANLSRQILHHNFKTEEAVLRSRITSKDHSALKLYRGFSRFMLEDLSLNPYTKDLSRSQLRKLSSKVSFEMIQRNEAYSNLVELLFPHHVRLSIHAHDNAGPKFGIRLFGPNVRPLETLSFDAPEMSSSDLLHVPTPWHNCLVEIAGSPDLIMTKSKIVRTALASRKYSGGWTQGSTGKEAGHFFVNLTETKKSNVTVSAREIDDNNVDKEGRFFTPVDTDLAYMGACIGIY